MCYNNILKLFLCMNIKLLCIGLLLCFKTFLHAQSLKQDSSVSQFTQLKLKYPLLFTMSFQNACKCDILSQFKDTLCELGFNVIQEGYNFSFVNKNIIKGSCWDYVNRIYKNSNSGSIKRTVYMSKKESHTFADKSILKPGDWIYHVNYDFNNVEHSAIFVCWKDYNNGIGITLSYAGMHRNTTAKFGAYNLNGVYAVYRLESSKKI